MSTGPVRNWQDMTTTDFASLDVASLIAILPLGAIEQHGPHLPLSTDRTIADGVITRAMQRLPAAVPAMVLPTQPIGLSVEHGSFPGTLSASTETLLRLWTEIGASVGRAGIRKLLLFNSHGGQSNLIGLVAQKLRSEHKMLSVSYHCYRIWRDSPQFDEAERRDGIHGGAIETSIMLALDPDNVRAEAARRFESAASDIIRHYGALAPDGRPAFAWEMQDLNPDGAAGDATNADAERGHVLIDAAAEQLVELLVALHRLDPDSILKSHAG